MNAPPTRTRTASAAVAATAFPLSAAILTVKAWAAAMVTAALALSSQTAQANLARLTMAGKLPRTVKRCRTR